MRVLLDESVPRRLAATFPSRSKRARCNRWAGLGARTESCRVSRSTTGFDALVTVDQGFAYQHGARDLLIPVVIMISGRTRLPELRPLAPEVSAVLSGDPGPGIHRVVT